MRLANYYPELNEEEMAFLCGVSKAAIHRNISEQSIDINFDKSLIKYRHIREYLIEEGNRDKNDSEISTALKRKYGKGYSRGTVHSLRVAPQRPVKGKISAVDLSFSPQMLPYVGESDGEILSLVRKNWLKNVPQFECDLTFGKGDFYSAGEKAPEKFRFDKYPDLESGVLPLNQASEIIENDSLMSVIIDLPQAISEEREGNSATFSSMEDMVISYYDLIKIANDKLKESFDKGPGGILVVKTGDFDYCGERLWLHHFVIDLATGSESKLSKRFFDILRRNGIRPDFNMVLVDKLIQIIPPQEEDNKERNISRQSHNYFLVFRKEKEEEVIYVRPGERSKHFPALHTPGLYRRFFIFGTRALDTLPKTQEGEELNRGYTREVVRKASVEDVIFATKPLTDSQRKRIEEYEGFPFGKTESISDGITGAELIDLIGNEIKKYNEEKGIFSELRKNERSMMFSRQLSDALYKCGFVYIDFDEKNEDSGISERGRVYFEEIV